MSGPAGNGAAAPASLVITGVSTGIGHAIANLAVAHGWLVFGSVRTEADADLLSKQFGAAFSSLLCDAGSGRPRRGPK